MTSQYRYAEKLTDAHEGVVPGGIVDDEALVDEDIKAEACAFYLPVDVSDGSAAREAGIGADCVVLEDYRVIVGCEELPFVARGGGAADIVKA